MHNTLLGYIVYGIQVLDFFNFNDKARYVLTAITRPMGQILATIVLLIIMVFLFSGIAFALFRDTLVSYNQCETLWHCFITILNFAPRLSGGIGDFLSPHVSTSHDMYTLTT